MKRPSEHVKEDLSRQILEKKIPPEWILRNIDPDYGIDKSLEIVKDGTVTGKEILIQLKGTETLQIHGEHISFSLKTDHIKYYLEKDLPVILVLVDITTENCYWIFLQHYAFDVMNINSPSWVDQKTVTIEIPLKQKISDTLDQIIDLANGGSAFLIAEKINQIPSKYLSRWTSNSEAIIKKSKIANNFLQKALQMRFEISAHHEKEGDYQKSVEVLEDIYHSALASKNDESALKAGLAIAYQFNLVTQNELVWNWLRKIEKLVKTVNNNTYTLVWNASLREVTYVKLVLDYNSLRRLELISSQKPGIMKPFLSAEIQKKIKELYKLETDFIYYLHKAFEDKEFLIYLDFLKRLAKLQWMWGYFNSLKGNLKIITAQMKSIENTLHLVKELSSVMSEDMYFWTLLDLAQLYHYTEQNSSRKSSVEEAMKIAKKLDHKGYLQGIERTKNIFEKSLTIPYLVNFDETKLTQKTLSIDQEDEIIKTLLKDAGIFFHGNSTLDKLARIGLKDRNPERILKYCENLFTAILTYGKIWDMVALPETGRKILFCKEKKYSVMGHSLDDLLEMYKEKYCKDCTNLSPRASDWNWSKKWHNERKIPEIMQKTINNFFKH